MKQTPMNIFKNIAIFTLIMAVSSQGIFAFAPSNIPEPSNQQSIEVEAQNGLLTITNHNEEEYFLRIYSNNGMLVVFKTMTDKEFTFNSEDFEGDRYYYSIKLENTHIKKGVINTIHNKS